MKQLFILLFLLGSSFAVCTNTTAPICGANGQTYANETAANDNGTIAIFCGTCAQYATFQASINVLANSSTSQLNTSNRSYMERFVSASFNKLIGNDEYGQDLLAILVGGFFFTFVSFQNIRIEGKAVVLIPAFILAAAFVNWIMAVLALGVGIIMYLALGKIFNK